MSMRIKIDDIEKNSFYKMPKSIYQFKDLKSIDREIYMLCLENWRLSVKNNWINQQNEIYFYSTHETLMELLNVSKNTIIKSFEKLIELKLLEVEKQKGKANIYFLNHISSSENEPVQKVNHSSSKNELVVVQNLNPNKNNNKNNIKRINNRYISDMEDHKFLADEKFVKTFIEFIKMRKKIKKDMTAYAKKLIMNDLDKLCGNDIEKAIKVLEQSILKSWQGVFKLKEEDHGSNNYNRRNNKKFKAKRDYGTPDYSEDGDW